MLKKRNETCYNFKTRPFHTFSIVARDTETGDMGVAVQSHWFSVGPIVPWAESGIGAVATQSFVNPAFGPDGLSLMKRGKSAKEALIELIESDSEEAVRQVALVDAKGNIAVHTGKRCIECAGHHTGKGYSVQANMMLNDKVVPAMANAFENSKGALAARLIDALEAGQVAGGDIRGKQSAAILVVRGESTGKVWEDRIVDLRVDDNPHPIKEIRRLYKIHLAYQHMDAGDKAIELEDMQKALTEYSQAAELYPENVEMLFWNAFSLANNDQIDKAIQLFNQVFKEDTNWIELLKRLPKSQLIDQKIVIQILKQLDLS